MGAFQTAVNYILSKIRFRRYSSYLFVFNNKPEQAIKLPSNLYIWDTKTLSKIQKWNII